MLTDAQLFDAKKLSLALFNAWESLDARLSLPAVVMGQIDSLREPAPETLPARKYFQEIVRETMLSGGVAWDSMRRGRLNKEARSDYLDGLIEDGSNLSPDGANTRIADPAYRRWAKLKYSSQGTPERTLWANFQTDARKAAVKDCRTFQETEGASASLTPALVQSALLQSFEEQKLSTVRVVSGPDGFALRVPLPLQNYHFDCRVRDLELLKRRVVPFDFELASSSAGAVIRISGDRTVWPGCAEYRNVCVEEPALNGLCTVLAMFVSVVVNAVDTIA
jgi:hypothetical protein